MKNIDKGYVSKFVRLGIYPIVIEVVIAIDIKKANEYFKKKFFFSHEIYPDVTSKTGLTRRVENRIAILIPNNANTEIVSHECTHAVCYGLSWVGVKYDDVGNNEILAYPIGYLCREVFNFMHDYRTKK